MTDRRQAHLPPPPPLSLPSCSSGLPAPAVTLLTAPGCTTLTRLPQLFPQRPVPALRRQRHCAYSYADHPASSAPLCLSICQPPCVAISPVPIHMPSVVLDRYQYTPSPQTIQQPRRTLCTLDSNHNGRPHLLRVRDIRRIKRKSPQGAMNCSPRDVSNERGDRAQTVHTY